MLLSISDMLSFHPIVLIIPVVSGLIGWGTNALAVKMLFAPVNRIGWKWLGWQGVIPANTERMARDNVRMITSQLLDAQKVFDRLEPNRISELLSPTLEKEAEEIVESVLATRYPKMWKRLPNRLKEKARNRLTQETPKVVDNLMSELKNDLNRYLDLEKLVVNAFVQNRSLLNELFWNCSAAEFIFIARSGLIFGGLFGLGQAVVWMFAQPNWFLPFTGLLVGWATNWLALKMIFEPLNPKKIGPWEWQGLFLKRQPEVSDAYAAFFAKKILRPQVLVDGVLLGPAADRITMLLKMYVSEAVEQSSNGSNRLLRLAVGSAEWHAIKFEIGEKLAAIVPGELPKVHDYAEEALDLEGELSRNLKALAPQDFEKVLRPLFQQDEKKLIAVGAVLGAVAGVVQWLILT